MKYLWNISLLLCGMLLWGACADGSLFSAEAPEAGGKDSPQGDVVLRCTAQLPSESAVTTRALSRNEQEGHISSAFYIFVYDGVCVGSSYIDNLDLNLSSGQVPLSTVGLDLVKGFQYHVYAVLNYKTYLGKDLTGTAWASVLKEKSEEEVKQLLSNGINGLESDYRIATEGDQPHSDLLFTSDFNFTFGETIAYCSFKCLSTCLVLDFSRFPANQTVSSVKVGNVPSTVPLFGAATDGLSFTPLKELEMTLDADNPVVRIYPLSNLAASTKEQALKLTLSGTRKMVSYVEVTTFPGFWGLADTPIDVPYKDKELFLLYSNDNYRFQPNQYADVVFFEAADQRGKLDYTVSSWPASDSGSRLLQYDSEGNVFSISHSSVNLDYASTDSVSYAIDGFPDGSFSRELFISYTGYSPSWEFELTGGSGWLTVNKSSYNNSLLLTATPNFTVTTDGGIRSSFRQASIKLTIYQADNQKWEKTITVSQQAAPLIPGDVDLGKFTVRGSNALMGKPADGKNPVNHNFYWVGPPASGSQYVLRGNSRLVASLQADMDNYRAKVNARSNSDVGLTVDQLKALCGTDYRLITADEMYGTLLPRLRQRYMDIDGESVLVYYIPGSTSLCFFPVIGSIARAPSAKYIVDNTAYNAAGNMNSYLSGFELSTYSMIVSTGWMRAGSPAHMDVRCVKDHTTTRNK